MLRFQVSNGVLAYEAGTKMTLTLLEDTYDADWKCKYPKLIKGIYDITGILQNCYGTYCVIEHEGLAYNIDPNKLAYLPKDSIPDTV